jgi:plastocyanin
MVNRNILLGAIIAAGLLVATASLVVSNIAAQPSGNMQGQGNNSINQIGNQNDERPSVQYALNKKYHDYKDGTFMVRAGAGSHVAPLTLFFPNHAEIKIGEKVVFYNPTRVSEPHTVTFVMDNSTMSDFAAPFFIDNKTAISSAVPKANAEPVIMPGQNGTKVIVALNNRSFMPTVIDSAGKVTYMPPNANYTLTGTEKYINSGWIWPKGMSPPGLPPIDSFSLTFSKAGTYSYFCEVHPWMSGDVVVK